jgi:hypothetical protein
MTGLGGIYMKELSLDDLFEKALREAAKNMDVSDPNPSWERVVEKFKTQSPRHLKEDGLDKLPPC